MKNFKKILSLILAITMVVTMFSINTLFSSADVVNNGVIEEIDVNLNNSQIVRNSNGGNVVFKLLEKEPLRADFWPCWDSLSGTMSYSEALMDLRSGDTPIRLTQGYKYAINVRYTVVKATSKPQIGIVYNIEDDLNVVNEGSHVLKAATHTATGSYMLSVVADGVENRPLRIAFGGQGQIVIESVEITRVANENLGSVKTVNLVDGSLTTKAFATENLETPVFEGAKETIFGGWYTDAAFTTPATDVVEDGTYYAKWASVLRYADLKSSNRVVDWDNTANDNVLYKDGNGITFTRDEKNNFIQVAVNQSSGLSFSANTVANYKPNAQVTLEYKDYDTNEKDNYYGDYVVIDSSKQYAITVDFDVIAYTSTAKIAIAGYSSNIVGGNGNTSARTIAGNNGITATGSYTISGTTNGTGLIDNTYGGGDFGGYKLRLLFDGKATFVIKSVTIQEVYKIDVNDGKSFGVYGNANGVNYKFAAYNDNGTWKLPEPIVYGEVTDKVFGGWYTDANFTTPVTTPVKNTTYYAKWLSITRKVDLKNSNRVVDYWDNSLNANVLCQNGNGITVTPNKNDEGITVAVNQSSGLNFSAGQTNVSFKKNAELTLEYYDYIPADYDTFYGGYANMNRNRQYAINIDYEVISSTTTPKIAVAAFSSNLGNNNGRTLAGNNGISGVGSYVTYSSLSGGGLVDYTYGGNSSMSYADNDNHKFRLIFDGVATFVINSVTIQEIYTADASAGNAIGVQYVEGGKTYKAAAVNKNGEWIMPTPNPSNVKGNVVDVEFDTWCSDSALTSPMSTPVLKTTYYPRWSPLVRELDLKNVNRMANYNEGQDTTILNVSNATDSKPLTVTVNGTNADSASQQITMEYYDADPNVVQDSNTEGYVSLVTGKLYDIDIKYNVTNVGTTAPTIAVMNSSKSISWASGQKTLISATPTKTGSYELSGIVGAGIDGAVANDKLRLVFNGQGTFEIESIVVTEIVPSADIIPVVYKSGTESVAQFANANSKLFTPTEIEGKYFMGWYNTNSQMITSISQLTNYQSPNVLTAKWIDNKKETEIDLSFSQDLLASKGTSQMVISYNEESEELKVDVDSYNDKLLSNGLSSKEVLWAKAILALKWGSGSDYTNYVKLQKDSKYILNVEYEVSNVNYNYNPEIAIVKNNSTNSSDDNGTVVLNANSHSKAGEYTISAVMSGIDNVPLRLAFTGVGDFVIKSATLIQINAEDPRYADLTYINDISSRSDFVEPAFELPVIEKEGYIFKGWHDANGVLVDSVDSVGSVKVFAKWIVGSRNYDIDLTNKFVVKQKPTNKDNIVMTVTDDKENKDLLVELNSDWNNVFADKDGNFNNAPLWPNAILGIRYNDGLDSSDFVRFDKNYKYVINLSYEVLEVDSVQLIQVALVNHIGTANQGDTHGSSVLNTATHKKVGKYKLSAVVSNLDNVALRLAFSGIGKINLTSMDVQVVSVEVDNMPLVNMATNEGVYSQFVNVGTELPILENTSFVNFGGWFNGNDKITTVSNDVDVTAKWYGKHDVTMNDETNILDLVTLYEASDSNNLLYDINRDGVIDNADLIAVKQYILGVVAIGENSLADYSVVKGAQKTLLTTLAAENFVSEVKTAFDIDLEIKDEASKKVVIGIEDIAQEVLDDQAINTLTGVRGDVYGINDFKVFVYNGNLYVEAGSDYATAVGVNALLDHLKGNFAFAGDFELSGTCTRASEMLDGYSYRLGDEFNDDTFNTNKWYFTEDTVQGTNYAKENAYYKASSASLNNSSSSDNFGGPWIDPEGNPNMQDGQIYYGENYTLNNGELVLNTKRIENGYSSAKINAKQKFTYGIMTARVKLATKNGATSAVWARTDDKDSEVVNEMDFCENYGAQNQVVPNLHTWRNMKEDSNHFDEIDYKKIVNYEEETYHELALVWTSEKITFYFDGEVYLEQDITDLEKWEAFHKSSYMIFDVSVPSNYYADAVPSGVASGKPGDILGSMINSFSENMCIDYVRIFQQ